MACPPPESWGHQFAVVLGPIHRHVGAFNILWFLPPYLAVAICTTEEVLLVVGHSEDVITYQAQHQDPYGISCAQLDRVVNQIQTLGSRKKETISDLLEIYAQDARLIPWPTVTQNRWVEKIGKSTLSVKLWKTFRKLCILHFLSLKFYFLGGTRRREKLQGCKQTRTEGKKIPKQTNHHPPKKPSTCRNTKRDWKDLEKERHNG